MLPAPLNYGDILDEVGPSFDPVVLIVVNFRDFFGASAAFVVCGSFRAVFFVVELKLKPSLMLRGGFEFLVECKGSVIVTYFWGTLEPGFLRVDAPVAYFKLVMPEVDLYFIGGTGVGGYFFESLPASIELIRLFPVGVPKPDLAWECTGCCMRDFTVFLASFLKVRAISALYLFLRWLAFFRGVLRSGELRSVKLNLMSLFLEVAGCFGKVDDGGGSCGCSRADIGIRIYSSIEFFFEFWHVLNRGLLISIDSSILKLFLSAGGGFLRFFLVSDPSHVPFCAGTGVLECI